MKGIIIYSTKTGTTKKCAEKIKEKIGFDCFDLRDKSFDKASFADYDFVVLGAPLRVGKLDKPMRKFLAKYGNYLLDKKLAIFGIGIGADYRQRMYAIYDNLIDESVCAVMLGGELVTEGVKGFKKVFVESLLLQYSQNGAPAPSVDFAELDKFCDKILSPELEIEFAKDLKAEPKEEEGYFESDDDSTGVLSLDILTEDETDILNYDGAPKDLDEILGSDPIDEDELDMEGGA